MNWTLLDRLRTSGYEPQDTGPADGEWFDLIASGIGTLRVVIFPDDGDAAEVHAFDKFMCVRWSARFSPGTPGAVITACLEAAERELADLRGGPVTSTAEGGQS